MMLKDKFGRKIDYLRLAVIDRCNLRCAYCMPEEGLAWHAKKDLMSQEEMFRICKIFTELGISKIRITGGEPFLRKDLIQFLNDISKLDNLENIAITTNGINTQKFIPDLKRLGINAINLSLDTLDKEKFKKITRRDEFEKVLETLDLLVKENFKIKINTVVMDGINIDDIIPLVELTKCKPISVRFIEEMPFNGTNHEISLKWNAKNILDHIHNKFPSLYKAFDEKNSTSINFKIPNFNGDFGIIAAYTRTFCGDCNRIRLTSSGEFRTCLYQSNGINLKNIMRQGCSDKEIKELIQLALIHKPKDGWDAQNKIIEKLDLHRSMATIGG